MNRQRIIDQLKKDEGFRAHAFWDIKQFTYGYGCRAPNGQATITEPEAAVYLEQKVDESIRDFAAIFGDSAAKLNDVQQEAFVNMIFNMGPGSSRNPKAGGMRSFVNTLGLILNHDKPDFGAVVANLKQSKWYLQIADSGDAPGRGRRICKEILTGEKA